MDIILVQLMEVRKGASGNTWALMFEHILRAKPRQTVGGLASMVEPNGCAVYAGISDWDDLIAVLIDKSELWPVRINAESEWSLKGEILTIDTFWFVSTWAWRLLKVPEVGIG